MNNNKLLLIYIEPTPYILALIERLQQRWPQGIDVDFASNNLSQRWELPLALASMQQLPAGWWQSFNHLRMQIGSGNYRLVHLAGWAGHPALQLAWVLAHWYGVAVSIESDTPLPPSSPWWKRAFKRLCYPLLFRLPVLFLPGGTRQANMLVHYGVESERICIAGMTVDVTAISRYRQAVAEQRGTIRLKLGIAGETRVFLYVGRMESHKGVQDLVDGFRQLRDAKLPSMLLLVGDGSIYDRLQEQVVGDKNIVCTGRLAGAELLDAYVAADVFVLPSHFEPWGLVVNEAMAASLPVIASANVGCVDDLVKAGESGLIFPAGNVEKLREAMRSLLEEGDLCRTMGDKARLLISGWTLEHEADRMVAAWKTVVNN